ncbi:MAG: hypothetical protein HY815_22065 [Candidatus Riflebacteria bacterium]|nr:hypothetical protein [Candidatus Riflebacteria bacterium]
MSEKRVIGAWNEWGRLREAVLGRVEEMIDPEYIPALVWVSEEGKQGLREKAGIVTRDGFPEEFAKMKHTVETLHRVLVDHGVTVHRTGPVPEGFHEEHQYLKDVQKGNYSIGGADFFRAIGKRVLLLNSFHLPVRRSYVWSVRRVLEPLLENSDATYFATPPPSPHYTRDELYLENGDMMVDGHNVYVGMSGNASTPKGVAWLKHGPPPGALTQVCVGSTGLATRGLQAGSAGPSRCDRHRDSAQAPLKEYRG